MDMKMILQTLENCELFKGLERSDIDKIASLCHMETYRAGEYIFHQGELGERIFIVSDGHVFLERMMDLGLREGKAVIGTLGNGRAFGCWSSILNEPHYLMSSALCKRTAKIVVMSGAGLRDIMLKDSKLGFKIMEKICLLLRDRIQGVLGAMEKI